MNDENYTRVRAIVWKDLNSITKYCRVIRKVVKNGRQRTYALNNEGEWVERNPGERYPEETQLDVTIEFDFFPI